MNEKILLEKLKRLEQKYAASGQNLESYLDGLYEADFLNYWDYIHLDTLLSLQVKRTALPDEEIFIIYHQITELYFRLMLVELEQICQQENPGTDFLISRLNRVNRYVRTLVQSFKVMSEGMDPEQFMRFRMALMPASGFQSVQYRCIELICTDVDNLVEQDLKQTMHTADLEKKMTGLYWRFGSTDLRTGEKTLTLKRFEEKYDIFLLDFARRHQTKNLRRIVTAQMKAGSLPEPLLAALRELDFNINLAWRSAHLQSANRYLKKPDGAVESTGGTNWRQYLPPKMQKIIFFPELWSEDEWYNWGRLAGHGEEKN